MWEKVRLGDYIQLLGGGTPSKDVEAYWNGDIPWVSVKDFKEDHITSTQDLITIEGVKNSATRIIPADTLLIATRMAVGKVAINTVDVAINQDIKAITCNKELFPKFLFYFFKANEQHLQSLASGATVKGIKINHITDLAIPLPPLPVQQRIADMLDKADALRRKDRELLKKYDELAQAIFIDMFGDPVKNEKGWEVKKLEQLGKLDRGVSKHRPRNAPELLGGPYPLIQTGDVANSGGWIKNYKSTYSEIGLKQSKMWPVNTLCITIAANIAKTGILTFDACFPDSIVGFNSYNQTNNVFVQYWFSFFQKILEEQAPESAQKNINLAILRNLGVIAPPIKLQEAFAKKIELINALKAKTNVEKSEKLFQSLLQRPFVL